MSLPDDVEVRILFFGKARELVDCEEKKIVVNNIIPYDQLKSLVFQQFFPVLSPIESSCILAVDQRYADGDKEVHLTPSSEIAVIPPLSGG